MTARRWCALQRDAMLTVRPSGSLIIVGASSMSSMVLEFWQAPY